MSADYSNNTKHEELVHKLCNTENGVVLNLKFHPSSDTFNLLCNGAYKDLKSILYQISSLDLSNCSLSDLPKCFGSPSIKSLNLSHNSFEEIPWCFYERQLTNIEVLDLSYNKIQDFEYQPDCVLHLKKLYLNNNQLYNIPIWLLRFQAANLEEFDYSENKADHYDFLINYSTFNLAKLKKLVLRNSCLIDKDVLSLKYFRYLEHLDISNKSDHIDTQYINKFKNLNHLFNLKWKHIKTLYMGFLKVSVLPKSLFSFKSLKELYVNNNMIMWFPDYIELLENLEILDVSNNNMILFPKEIVHLKRLKILKLSGNRLEEISSLPQNLRVLDLYENDLENIPVSDVNRLQFVDLELNYLKLEEYNDYALKRDQYRLNYKCENRYFGTKFKIVQEDLDDFGSQRNTDSSEYEFEDENICVQNTCPLEEDWDSELKPSVLEIHPDISLSDNEWNGNESITFTSQDINRKYSENIEWMFVDADEV